MSQGKQKWLVQWARNVAEISNKKSSMHGKKLVCVCITSNETWHEWHSPHYFSKVPCSPKGSLLLSLADRCYLTLHWRKYAWQRNSIHFVQSDSLKWSMCCQQIHGLLSKRAWSKLYTCFAPSRTLCTHVPFPVSMRSSVSRHGLPHPHGFCGENMTKQMKQFSVLLVKLQQQQSLDEGGYPPVGTTALPMSPDVCKFLCNLNWPQWLPCTCALRLLSLSLSPFFLFFFLKSAQGSLRTWKLCSCPFIPWPW